MWRKIRVQFHSFACGYPFSQHHLLARLFFLSFVYSCTFVKYQLTVHAWVYLCALYLLHWLHMSAFMLVLCCFDYCSFENYLIYECNASNFCFSHSLLLGLYFSISVKLSLEFWCELHWIWDSTLDTMDIIIVIIIPPQ